MATAADAPVAVDVSLDGELDVEFRGGRLTRDRPFSASQRSTASTKSVVSLNPSTVTSAYTATNLFAFRDGAFDKAVDLCKTSVVKDELDGPVQGTWLITEIDHWDMEKEKLVLLTTNSILIVRFNFIQLSVTDFRRIFLKSVRLIEIGDIVYPSYSMMPARQHGGVRITWGNAQPSFAQRWNPFTSDIGYVTLSHHLLAYKPEERETVTYDVGDFIDSVIAATNEVRKRDGLQPESVEVVNAPVVIDSYGSFVSLVFNQSHLGFNLARGGVSF